MPTVHLIYVKGDSIATPIAITNQLQKRLRKARDIKVYDWCDTDTIRPNQGDILIGHPHPFKKDAIFNTSFKQPGWAQKIVFCPFAHGIIEVIAFLEQYISDADLFIAICGKYWIDTIAHSLVSHWEHKIVRCDLAVSKEDFPRLKLNFNPPGHRRFLYIGNTTPAKGVDFLAAIADHNQNLEISWIGRGSIPSSKINALGPVDFSSNAAKSLIPQFDFLLTCGRSDANPTTILEATSWGLLPIATIQSGYYEDDWLTNIYLDDIKATSCVLQEMNICDENKLISRQEAGFNKLEVHYNWDRVAELLLNCFGMPMPQEPTNADWQVRKTNNKIALARIQRKILFETSIAQAFDIRKRFSKWALRKLNRK